MSFLDSVSQRSGNIEKAIIEIIDLRGRKVVVEPPVEVQGGGLAGRQSSIPSMPALNAFETFTDASSLAGTIAYVDKAAGLDVSGGLSDPLPYVNGATRKLFYVQFNPNELSLSGYAGRPVKRMDFSKEGIASEYTMANPRITMNVKLIFDKTDPQDAFMGDKLNMSVTSIATGGVKAVRSLTGKKDNSVQTEVDGLIAALRSTYTRRITFHWGTMNYTGILNRVSAEYTMFNVLGLPIRAYVDLSLTCADESVSPGSMGIWQEYYEQLFDIGDQSYVKAAQKAGNWINFNV
ncbi:MAG: hypothetical protein HDR02_02610 [Lachnospiraceae bacterium]|nr:hypothetical protein [Lachnospiraceae bacterium]